MPKISTKGEAMPSSPIRKLVPYAEAAKKTGAKVYHLNIGQPDLETPPQFWEKLRTMDMKVLAYCPSDGFESYKAQFAKYYNNIGIAVDTI
jgi:aspartate aminotransferase